MPSDFYPQLFRKTRPYAKDFIKETEALEAANKLNYKTALDTSFRFIQKAFEPEGISITDPNFDMHRLSAENQLALNYGQWALTGANLFALEPELAAALDASGVGEVTLADINFPFSSFYIDFGGLPGMALKSGAAVTGAYLQFQAGTSLRVGLTAPLPPEAPWTSRYIELYDLRILAEHFHKDIESAIDLSLDADVEDLRSATAKYLENNPHRTEPAKQAAGAYLESLMSNRDVYSRSLNLIASALCYVTAYPEDIKESWQAGTPERLREKADTAAPKESARAASKLQALGFRKVRYVGTEFSAASEKAEGGHISPHWRKGHWRMQPYGPQSSLRKLKWLKPMRILGGRASEEPRVYTAR